MDSTLDVQPIRIAAGCNRSGEKQGICGRHGRVIGIIVRGAIGVGIVEALLVDYGYAALHRTFAFAALKLVDGPTFLCK